MYDTNDTQGGEGGSGAPTKMPHRPAPPVPSAKHNNSGGKNIATQSGEDEIQKFDSVENKKKSRWWRFRNFAFKCIMFSN